MFRNLIRKSPSIKPSVARSFSATALHREEFQGQLPSLYSFTEEESMFREAVSKYSREILAPRVRDMDENELVDKDILQSLFDNGLMGLEVDSELGGAGASFMSAIIVVEGIHSFSTIFIDVQSCLKLILPLLLFVTFITLL